MLLENHFYHNPILAWLIAVFIFFITIFVLQIIKKHTIRRIDRLTSQTPSEWDDLIPLLIQRFHFILFVLFGLYLGAHVLDLPDRFWLILKKTGMIAALLQTGIWVSCTIRFWLNIYRKLHIDRNAGAYTTVSAVAFIVQVILWTILFLLVLANLGVNITALLTGLGVGGIAIALAVQNILGDLFASFSIILDKPFVIGDFIIVDEYLGTIEKIGIKTTRIRSLSGEQLVFSNTDLLKSRIRNYKRMFERRVVFGFGIVYQTSYLESPKFSA